MSETPVQKPNCYACRYRGAVPGNAHICCLHPEVRAVGGAIAKLGITANPHGIARGWFIWPFCFDPVWLRTCNGYTERQSAKGETRDGQGRQAQDPTEKED